ncbi:hypothetical protein GCM10027290_01840 [Micromonospora sonneratiae]|uniref:SagB-type dehydrogenase domain-containing protein n=1 Tax=Micromonospora sonneratiae TaxID=1184706 RepID=A0ABW3Y5P2_9ACTN
MDVQEQAPPTADGPVERYLAAVEGQSGNAPATYAAPRGKRYPGSLRRQLRWPGPGAEPLGDSGLDRLSALLLGYAPSRLEMLTTAGFSALTGRPGADHGAARFLPAWFTLRRDVPSGGAFYPAEVYLFWTGSAELSAGVYHYDNVHHCLELLHDANPAADLDRLLGGPTAEPRHALWLTCRPWKNAGKYRAFGYQLSTVDTGVLLGQFAVSPLAGRVRLDVDPVAADNLLGLDGEVESVLAVIELPGDAFAGPGAVSPAPGAVPIQVPVPTGLDADRLNLAGADPAALALHREMSGRGDPRQQAHPSPATPPGTVEPAAGACPIELPAATRLDLGTVRGRASAGDLVPGLRIGQLADILVYASGRLAGSAALADLVGHPRYPTLWCLVSQVIGLAPGAYRYDPRLHVLAPSGGAADPRLPGAVPFGIDPRMSTAGATIFFVAGGHPPMRKLTPAALRHLHLLTGVAVQLSGLAGQAVGAAARPVGGFSPQAAAARLGLPDGELPIVQMLIGAPKTRAGSLAVAFTEGSSDAG